MRLPAEAVCKVIFLDCELTEVELPGTTVELDRTRRVLPTSIIYFGKVGKFDFHYTPFQVSRKFTIISPSFIVCLKVKFINLIWNFPQKTLRSNFEMLNISKTRFLDQLDSIKTSIKAVVIRLNDYDSNNIQNMLIKISEIL
jgi:hypothetical protein